MRKIEEKLMRDHIQNEYGVTLIELIVVVAVIGIMIGISAISFSYVAKERLSSATRGLVADIQQKRVDALTSGQTVNTIMGSGIRFVPPASYVLFTWNDINTDFLYSGVSEEVSATTNTLSSNLTLNIQDAYPLYTVLIYNRLGVPKRYMTDGTPLEDTLNMTIDLQANNANIIKCINVSTNAIREGVISGTTCIQQ